MTDFTTYFYKLIHSLDDNKVMYMEMKAHKMNEYTSFAIRLTLSLSFVSI